MSSILSIPTRAYLWRRLTIALSDLEEVGVTRKRLKRGEAQKQLELLNKLEGDIKLLKKPLLQAVEREAVASNEEKSSFEASGLEQRGAAQ